MPAFDYNSGKHFVIPRSLVGHSAAVVEENYSGAVVLPSVSADTVSDVVSVVIEVEVVVDSFVCGAVVVGFTDGAVDAVDGGLCSIIMA